MPKKSKGKKITITRRVRIFVAENDPELKKEYIHTIYKWRDELRRAANIIVAHKFCQQNIKDFVYIKDEIKEKFYVKDILAEGKGMSEQNTTYRVLADLLKGKVPSEFYSCLNQSVANTFKETYADIWKGKASLRSYKNNILMPFGKERLEAIKWSDKDKRFYFTLFGIPFGIALGRDRSNNKVMIERCLSGEYQFCGSGIMIDDSKDDKNAPKKPKKAKRQEEEEKSQRGTIYLYMTISLPKQKPQVDPDKICFATLGVANPISAQIDGYDWVKNIGTADEYLHRRRQIQEGLRRLQTGLRYANGGHGRNKKLKTLDTYREYEQDYIKTKMHQYSRMLVNFALKNGCGTIRLVGNDEREDMNKSEELLIRNWNYSGLKTMLEYKCAKYGIVLDCE